MCRHSSSSFSPCACDGTSQSPLSSPEAGPQQPNMLTPLISKNPPITQHTQREPTAQEQLSKPTHLTLALSEAKAVAAISLPMMLTGLLLYSRSIISMLFLGHLGELSLAGGALAIGFANITGYSILSGLAMGMEPICGQAFGAKRHTLLGLSLQRTVLLLLSASLPIALLWINMKRMLLLVGQEADIAQEAQSYILFSLPDLLAMSFLHPLRIYLRTQSITLPLTCCALLSLLLHVPINYLLVSVLRLGIRGVALGSVSTNFNLVAFLIIYIWVSRVYKGTWDGFSRECFKGWKSLLNLAIPSCVSVCLEWWWYEIMILLCGVLLNPKATVASMGILIQTTALIYIFPSSLSFGVSTRVSNELGAGRPKQARRAAAVGLACSFALGLAALVFAVAVRRSWATMFSGDGDILALTSAVLPIIGLCELGNCPQTAMCGVLRGTAQPKTGANINLGSFYAVGMPVGVGLAFWAGYDFRGLWFGLMAAQYTCVLLMLLVLARTDWELQAERAKKLTASATAVAPDVDEEAGKTADDEEPKETLNSIDDSYKNTRVEP